MATRKSSGKNRKRDALRKAEQAVNLIKPPAASAEDKSKMAEQCYHNTDATMLGTYSSMLSKYAVFYNNRWYFCVYNRDARAVVELITMDMLSSGETVRFLQFKNRLEVERRAQRLNTLKK